MIVADTESKCILERKRQNRETMNSVSEMRFEGADFVECDELYHVLNATNDSHNSLSSLPQFGCNQVFIKLGDNCDCAIRRITNTITSLQVRDVSERIDTKRKSNATEIYWVLNRIKQNLLGIGTFTDIISNQIFSSNQHIKGFFLSVTDRNRIHVNTKRFDILHRLRFSRGQLWLIR